MKILSRLAIPITMLVLIPIQQAAATAEYYSMPGITCQPANLNQAANLNATWNQARVFNPNPTSGSLSFFVTCPVVFGESVTFDPGEGPGSHDIYVYLHKPPGTQNVECSGRRYTQQQGNPANATQTSTFTIAQTVTVTTGLTSNGAVRIILNNIATAANLNGLSTYFVVLCALTPQTGVNSLHFDYD